MNDLSKLFSGKNLLILKEISEKEETYIREISENTDISPAQVHTAVNLFRKLGFIRERMHKNKKLISLDTTSQLLGKTRQLINTFELQTHASFKELQKNGIVGIYGSFAAGTDTPESDIDMWIYSQEYIDAVELKETARKIEKEFKKEVKLLILNPEKIKNMKENDPEFYYRLKLTSTGEDIFD